MGKFTVKYIDLGFIKITLLYLFLIRDVMLDERKVILGSKESPLMVLEKYKIKPKLFNFKKAYQELFSHEQERSEAKCQWGYFPGFEKDEHNLYPNCIKLAGQFEKSFLSKMQKPLEKNLQLAFIRMASKEISGSFGGFHIDVDPGVNIVKDAEQKNGTEVLRLLINLHDRPRKLKYTPLDRFRLREMGIEVSDDQYVPINIPDSIPQSTIEIPPIEKDAVYSLKLWSSLIPHMGLTDEKGHFLISYGAYVNRKDVDYKL